MLTLLLHYHGTALTAKFVEVQESTASVSTDMLIATQNILPCHCLCLPLLTADVLTAVASAMHLHTSDSSTYGHDLLYEKESL